MDGRVNYKKLIKSRKLRMKILGLLVFVPDKLMLEIQYYIKLHRKLNLKNPQRFTEKLQWYKLYYREPLMRQCADKYEVRKYVKDCGLSEILNPIVGVYEDTSQITFDTLPKKCVFKDTLGGGGNAVIICQDKEKLNLQETYQQMKEWLMLSTSYKTGGREWVYGGRKHRIIIENFLESNPEEGGLIDYKFFCFDGKAEYLYVIADREVGKQAGFGIFNANYEQLPVVRGDEKPLERHIPKPTNYDEMVKIAEKLAAPFPHVRVDLYNINGKIMFGEMTFFNASGYMSFEPDEFDFVLGEKFGLPEKRMF